MYYTPYDINWYDINLHDKKWFNDQEKSRWNAWRKPTIKLRALKAVSVKVILLILLFGSADIQIDTLPLSLLVIHQIRFMNWKKEWVPWLIFWIGILKNEQYENQWCFRVIIVLILVLRRLLSHFANRAS